MIDNLVNTEDEATDQLALDDHQPDSVILLPDDMPFSYQEGEAAALAAVLAGVGVRQDERVLVLMPDGAGFSEAVIGTILQTAVPLPVNPSVRAGVLATVAADTGARLAVVAPERSSRFARLRPLRMVPVQGPRGTWAMVLLLS